MCLEDLLTTSGVLELEGTTSRWLIYSVGELRIIHCVFVFILH